MNRTALAPGHDMCHRYDVRKSWLAGAIVLGLALALGVRAYMVVTAPRRSTPVYDPPVLAGQWIPGYCSAGVYARVGDRIVLTTSPHCAGEGTVARDPATGVLLGTIGPTAKDATCPYPGHTCAASDLNYLIVDAARIPWGHLDQIDMGVGGYRTLEPGTRPLACADIAVGDGVAIDSRGDYRTGSVVEKGDNLKEPAEDGAYFPCMVAADIKVGNGDSGGVVLVRGLPGGVVSRNFGGYLGFTPLAEGMAELGLTMCTTPNCDLTPPQ